VGSPTNTIFEARGLVKTFPGVRALDNVAFELERGEVHALVGENGAGKSTFIHVLAGVHSPDAGALVLEGAPLRLPSPLAASEHRLGVVFQEHSLSPNLSVAENVFVNRQPLRKRLLNLIDWARLHKQTAAMLELFDMDIDPQTPVRQLSPAHQQLVEILKAMAIEPKILVLDEPTSSLTAPEVERLFDNMRRLKAQGVSFIYVSHHLPEVFEIADRVTVFRDGKHVHTTRVSDITERELVSRMVGRELADLYGERGEGSGRERFRIDNAGRDDAFRDVSFAVRGGEIVGLAGLTGAGRTELGRAIFGVEPLDSGHMFLDGKPLAVRSPAEAISKHIAYLTEDRKEQGLFLDMAVRENCAAANLAQFTTAAGLMNDPALNAFAQECVDAFNIVTPSLEQKVLNLSGGNQQKVLLAMWMATRPTFLIVDEPTRGVDIGARGEIYHRLRELAASGVAILMISSDLPEILGASDRILVMRNGRLVGELDAREASEEAVIAYATGLGAPDVEQAGGNGEI